LRHCNGADDPLAFVISKNLKRRHLDESQRAMVAAKLANMMLGDNQHAEGLPIGSASEMLNVGERTVARARAVIDHGHPELVSSVERGEVAVSAAAEFAKQPAEELEKRKKPPVIDRGPQVCRASDATRHGLVHVERT
jgi:hypothetical protein